MSPICKSEALIVRYLVKIQVKIQVLESQGEIVSRSVYRKKRKCVAIITRTLYSARIGTSDGLTAERIATVGESQQTNEDICRRPVASVPAHTNDFHVRSIHSKVFPGTNGWRKDGWTNRRIDKWAQGRPSPMSLWSVPNVSQRKTISP